MKYLKGVKGIKNKGIKNNDTTRNEVINEGIRNSANYRNNLFEYFNRISDNRFIKRVQVVTDESKLRRKRRYEDDLGKSEMMKSRLF